METGKITNYKHLESVTVGQQLFCRPASIFTKRYYSEKFVIGTVTKIGRIYFTVRIANRDVRFTLDRALCANEYATNDWILFESEHDLDECVQAGKRREEIRKCVDNSYRVFPSEMVNELWAVLEKYNYTKKT